MRNHYLENPEIIGEGKLEPRASMVQYNDLSSYKEGNVSEQIPLNGSWKFKLSIGIENRPKDFYEREFDASTWSSIDVPGLWQLQDYHKEDKPYYLAYSYPPEVKTRRIPKIDQEKNSVGSYLRKFYIKKQHANKQFRLHFGAVKSAFHVWLNGSYIGYSQGSMTPAEFDITDFAQEGINQLAVEVYRYSDATYVEDQDMWFLSGIYRDVYIEVEPLTIIEDIYAKASFNEDYSEGLLQTKVKVTQRQSQKQPIKVKTYLQDLVNETFITLTEGRLVLEEKKAKEIMIESKVFEPKLWSAEQPNLYKVIVLITDQYDEAIQVKTVEFGFKEVKIVDGVFLFNGSPLLIKGVNRHEFDPNRGWVPSRELYLKDFAIMKSLNINAIRTSHYPNDPLFYKLCNELGFYVMDEADVESHGIRKKGIPGKKKEWLKAIVDRGVRMVVRDRNHPCIMIWSLGNEAGYGPNFIKMKNAMMACDHTRPYHYEGDQELFVSDFFSTMYGEPDYMRRIGEGEDMLMTLGQKIENLFMAEHHEFYSEDYKGKPAVLCEYAHAMNNSLGNFEDYMILFKKYPTLCGGFIWDFVDQTLRMTIDGEEQWYYGGDFGEKVTNGQFCANGIIGSNRELHPSAYEVKKVYQPLSFSLETETGLLTVVNEQLFSDTSNYQLRYRVLENGEPIKEVILDDFNIEAQEKHIYDLKLEQLMIEDSSLYHITTEVLTAEDVWWSEKGYVIAFEQFTIEPTVVETVKIQEFNGKVNEEKGQINIDIESSKFQFELSTGQLKQVVVDGEDLLTSPLKANFWRVPIDNDYGLSHFMPFLRRFILKDYLIDLADKARVKSYDHYQDGSNYRIDFKLKIPKFSDEFTIQYTLDGSGELSVNYSGRPKKELDRFGAVVEMPHNYDRVSWFGKGPHENYCDRNSGAPVGIYHQTIDEMVHPYVRPQENGQRTGTYWINLVSQKNEISVEAIDEPLEFSAWPYSAVDLYNSSHIHEQSKYLLTTLHIDAKQKGVGGDYPGALNLKETYKIHKNENHSLAFRIKFSTNS